MLELNGEEYLKLREFARGMQLIIDIEQFLYRRAEKDLSGPSLLVYRDLRKQTIRAARKARRAFLDGNLLVGCEHFIEVERLVKAKSMEKGI